MGTDFSMRRQTRVARSLVDRVLGGVCGGLSAYLGINPWWARALAVVLTVLTGGVAGLLYLILWWTLPPDLTPGEAAPGRDLGKLLLVGLLIVLAGAAALARGLGLLSGPQGLDLFWPGVIVVVGLTLLWREWRS